MEHQVQRGPVEHHPAQHQAAGEEREHVEVEIQLVHRQHRPALEAAHFGQRRGAHRDAHRRPQLDRRALEAHVALERRG
ncbi:MAG: hypothetical protein A2V63_08790 [Candidatus Eisenbacteria bacterium RBG_19FT_COMBO_70_11]|nr:MAG: hypothetical protein A2V63_08790 [Candidatus Eisenbacteria bacterium RBG_19FT_COMBO_70_11]